MGKRKTSSRTGPAKVKPVIPLPKIFDCPFCQQELCVECKIDHNTNIGKIYCRLCNEHFQMPVHHLDEAIDVYNAWIDACDAQNGIVMGDSKKGHD
uniref:Transcription elongation factor 1 homolog n=1 Tax=Parastrongyloides trichosuri TaxID=131310 RepID=A0A0N4ZP22_PARTI